MLKRISSGLMHLVMRRRARKTAERLRSFLVTLQGRVLDLGSGTGHNGEEFRRRHGLAVVEVDVTDFSAVARSPLLFDGERLPFTDNQFEAVTMLYVLHYCEDPVALLREVNRVCSGKVLLLQSVYSGRLALQYLKCRDFLYGRGGLYLARLFRAVREVDNPMKPRRFYSNRLLVDHFREAGFRVVGGRRRRSGGCWVNRGLFVLEPCCRKGGGQHER